MTPGGGPPLVPVGCWVVVVVVVSEVVVVVLDGGVDDEDGEDGGVLEVVVGAVVDVGVLDELGGGVLVGCGVVLCAG